jgi:ribosome maturation factor RimP
VGFDPRFLFFIGSYFAGFLPQGGVVERKSNMSVARVSSQTSPVVDRVTSLVSPIVSDLGLDLYDIEYTGGIVRIVVDTQPGGPSGVSLENIALITRLVSREFDHSDPVPGRYTLEVTSPGLERTLRLPRHFVREVGKTVAIRLSSALDGQRRIQGNLVSANEETIVVALDDATLTEVNIPLSMVDRAKTVFQWGPTPKSGVASSQAKSKKSTSRLSGAASDTDETDTDMEVDAL